MKLPVCLLLLIPVCLARDGVVSWSGLQLKPGQKVIALRNDGSRLAGAIVAATQDELRLRSQGADLVVKPATIASIQVKRNTVRWRITGTVLGSAAGLFGGAAAAWSSSGISGSTGAAATLFAIWTGGTVTGFFLGRQADQRSDNWTIQKP